MPFGFIQSGLQCHPRSHVLPLRLPAEIKSQKEARPAAKQSASAQRQGSHFHKESKESVRDHPLNVLFDCFKGFFLAQTFLSTFIR